MDYFNVTGLASCISETVASYNRTGMNYTAVSDFRIIVNRNVWINDNAVSDFDVFANNCVRHNSAIISYGTTAADKNPRKNYRAFSFNRSFAHIIKAFKTIPAISLCGGGIFKYLRSLGKREVGILGIQYDKLNIRRKFRFQRFVIHYYGAGFGFGKPFGVFMAGNERNLVFFRRLQGTYTRNVQIFGKYAYSFNRQLRDNVF